LGRGWDPDESPEEKAHIPDVEVWAFCIVE